MSKEYYTPKIGDKFRKKNGKPFIIIDAYEAGDGLDAVFVCKYASGAIRHMFQFESILSKSEFEKIKEQSDDGD